MAKKFETLRAKMSPTQRAASDKEYKKLREEMSLAKLRGAMELTQQTLAATLEIDQSQVARMEKRTDMLISTLSSYVQALGGTLEVRASFPDGKVYNIAQFSGLAKTTE
jgi:hypothetical protein